MHKSVGVAGLFVFFVAIFTYFAFQLTSHPTSTNTRASAPVKTNPPRPIQPIIKGTIAADGEFPFHATLFTKEGFLFCGGTLISEEWVLTAGHCLYDYKQVSEHGDPKEIEVMIGLDHLNTDLKALHYSTIDKYYIHEYYEPYNLPLQERNDIALIHLSTPAKGIPTLSLFNPDRGEYLERIGMRQPVTAIGFGLIELYTATYDLRKTNTMTIEYRGTRFRRDIITLKSTDGSYTWHGDSGSSILFPYRQHM